jgi:DNA-binding response OmpR family regulator
MLLALRDTVSEMILLAKEPDEIARLRRSLSGLDAVFLEKSNEGTLIARIREIMELADRTAREDALAPTIIRIADRTLDLASQILVDAEGQEVALTRAETGLLKELARNPGRILSRDKLRHAVAGHVATPLDRSMDPFDRSIDMLIARLRRKIEPDPKAPRFLVTVQGVGYKLMAPAASADARPSGAEPTEPERRQITALSCNLVGAMEFAVSFDPEDLSTVTKSFQDAAMAAITAERLPSLRLTKFWRSSGTPRRMRTMPNAR